jgi:hypothetical protein
MLNSQGVGYKRVKSIMSHNSEEQAGDIASTHSCCYEDKDFMDCNDSESSDDITCLGLVFYDEEEAVEDDNYVTRLKEIGLKNTGLDKVGATPENPIVIQLHHYRMYRWMIPSKKKVQGEKEEDPVTKVLSDDVNSL